MPETDIPSSNRARLKFQQESRKRASSTDQGQTTPGPADGIQELQYPGKSSLDSDFSQATFERHAALLGDSRLSSPANAKVGMQIVRQLQRDYGNQYVQRLVSHVQRERAEAIQTKLEVGPAGDKYEQEADQVAKQVVGMTSPTGEGLTQRQGSEDEELLQGKPDLAQRQIGVSGGSVEPELEDSIEHARSGGQPLQESTLESMEGAFGADFSDVRVHTGIESDALNESVSARAFTVAKDIFFRNGEYNDSSSSGKEILAHELTHVVQQGGAQRLGNKGELTAQPGPHVQRHPEGTELPDSDAQASEIGVKENAAPPATRTAADETAETGAATKAGADFLASQAVSQGAMSLAGAQKILQGSFGDIKSIVPGTIVVLANQAACSAMYDKVCAAAGIFSPFPPVDGSATPLWQAGDRARIDERDGIIIEGFAWEGVTYVNGESTLVTVTAHEVLHNNTGPDFRATAGETFNEGVTEILARAACEAAGIPVPHITAYPTQISLTQKLIDFVGMSVVQQAYFGNVQTLVDAYTSIAAGTWVSLKGAAEALDAAMVDAALTPKP